MISLPISTSFGSIRPWAARDEDALCRYGSSRAIWLNMRDGFPHPFNPQAARDFLERAAAQAPTMFCALATPQEAIGGIGISPGSDVHRLTGELGYWLAEPYWGRGIMSEAVRAFCTYAFEQFHLVRIYAEPYAANPASARVLEKAGFQLEAILRSNVVKDGKILDQCLYARINDAFML